MESAEQANRVVALLRQQAVATFANLEKQLRVSRRTLRRALSKHGYYSSCNHNGTYVTLRETPRFTPDGLWTYRKACFSSHGTLLQTIQALVETSPNGKTVVELEEQLQTRVHNQLSWLLQQQQLTHCYWGRHTVYLSYHATRAAAQQHQRQEQSRTNRIGAISKAAPTGRCPEGMRVETVIRLLVQMIAKPEASPASLAKQLRSQGIAIEAQQVRRVIAFYSLEKKRNAERLGPRARVAGRLPGRSTDAAGLPDHATYNFDQDSVVSTAAECAATVLKTTRRQVVSLRFSRFESHEVVRRELGREGGQVRPSPQLASVVPKGGRYAYDLITYVGRESLLRGRKLQDIAVDLAKLQIPFSSLYDLQRKFLFYLDVCRERPPRRCVAHRWIVNR